MSGRLVRVVLLLIAFAAAPADGASLLFLDNRAGTHVDANRSVRIEDATGAFTAQRLDSGSIRIEVDDGQSTRHWWLYFSPPLGETLSAGEYLNPDTSLVPNRPAFSVSGDVAGCGEAGGRFVIHELEIDGSGTVVAFSADFERPCQLGADPVLFGAVRHRVGDAACALASDGTPCELRDACAGGGACDDGVCRGVEPIICAPEHDQCETPAVCDPTSGTCLAPGFAEYRADCDDGNACTQRDWCIDGVCEPGYDEVLGCDDFDRCTEDFCDADVGCRHAPIGGGCGAGGEPSTVFFVVDEPGDGSTKPAEQLRITSADAEFSLEPSDDHLGFLIWPSDPNRGVWFVEVGPREGERLEVGVYEGAGLSWSAAAPVLDVDGCSGPGRFEVIEITRGTFDRVEAISFRFEQQCADGGRRWGTLNYRAGFERCRALPDGEACDDLNACSASSSCRAGVCVGDAAPVCSTSDSCRPEPFCEPIAGTCVEGVVGGDGAVCDDADPCTTSGLCQAGVCGSTTPIVTCACLDVPDGGACWTLAGTTVVRASAVGTLRGHAVRCAGSCQRPQSGLFITNPDGTYWAPGGVASCADGRDITVPAEVGRWEQKRNGTMVLAPDNFSDIAFAAEACSGVKLKALRTLMEPTADGSVAGRTVLRYRQRAQLPITFKSTVHFNGTSDPLASVEAPLKKRPTHTCAEQLRLQCYLR